MAVLAITTRSGAIENEFHGYAAVADADGRLVGWVGDPGARFYLRSSAKPLQALSVVASGAHEAWGMTPKELAVCCASHSGSLEHQETVLGLLAKAGLSEEHLLCGTHMPGDADAARSLATRGAKPTPVHNNCSGKHAGMLVTARHLGASLDDYLSLDHPVQQAILGNLSRLTGLELDAIHIGVDGCGAPVHNLPLRAMATAFARLASRRGLPEGLRGAALAVRRAVSAQPHMVAHRGHFNSELLAAFGGDCVAKAGAEALFCAGFAASGLGIAVKIGDGSFRAMPPIVLRILRQMGLSPKPLAALAPFERLPVHNCRNEAVGWVEATDFVL
ncbi:MAG: asparaginase [Armatimonadetes bacterium]|nr:asparaginase [Armatimonadota bacterium]